MPLTPAENSETIAQKAREHLEQVVRIDSASDETSTAIPSSQGQINLVSHLEGFFHDLGAEVESDPHANLVATLPARGGASGPPLALLVHVDTARGTRAVEELTLAAGWDGSALSFPARPDLEVGVDSYPSLARFVGHDVLHGAGDAPFGLDDKLGLTHLMTLAWLLARNPSIPHPTLHLVGRPDEEIGRMEAVTGLASLLAERGVRAGYTVDGIEPFEVNVANFNGAGAAVWFDSQLAPGPDWPVYAVHLGGVNTHGATAKAEGHRPATRFAAELLDLLAERRVSGDDLVVAAYHSDELRDCDGTLAVYVRDDAVHQRLEAAIEAVVGPHRARGASWRSSRTNTSPVVDRAATDALAFISRFLRSDPGFVLAAEESDGWDGYSQPYRLVADGKAVRLDVRLRDFDAEKLRARGQHVRTLAGGRRAEVTDQYINMGPALAARPELVEWARAAGTEIGVETPLLPIRGGTGVDPFLAQGVAIANLGTGYFAPESEKELTTMQLMAQHASWLIALVQIVANAGSDPR